MSKFAKGINSKNAKGDNFKKYFCNFHQVIYLLSSTSCPSLKLLSVTVFEISRFLCPNLQKGNNSKNVVVVVFFNFHLVIFSVSYIN